MRRVPLEAHPNIDCSPDYSLPGGLPNTDCETTIDRMLENYFWEYVGVILRKQGANLGQHLKTLWQVSPTSGAVLAKFRSSCSKTARCWPTLVDVRPSRLPAAGNHSKNAAGRNIRAMSEELRCSSPAVRWGLIWRAGATPAACRDPPAYAILLKQRSTGTIVPLQTNSSRFRFRITHGGHWPITVPNR